MPEELTARQRQVYDAIAAFYAKNGRMPTYRVLCDLLDIKSPNGLMCHMNSLLRKGWIEWPELKDAKVKTRPMYGLKLLVCDELQPSVKRTRKQISVTLYGPITADQARELARQLIETADEIEAIPQGASACTSR